MTSLSRSIPASVIRRVDVPYFPSKSRTYSKIASIALTPEPTARVCGIFVKGQCHALALALHDLTGWPILGQYSLYGGSRHTSHFVVSCPVEKPYRCEADATGVHCTDSGFRSVNPDTIRNNRLRGFLPPAMEFARHFAPMILREINVQLESTRAGKGRPYWPFCWDGTYVFDKETGKTVKTHA